MNKIKVKILEEERYIIKKLQRLQIDIFKIEKIEDALIYTIDEKDLEKLENIDIEIVTPLGIKNIIYKIKQNRHFIAAIIISIILMFVTSNIVVDVDIIHSDKEIREIIDEELTLNGIKTLSFKKTFNQLQIIKERIKSKYRDKIEWLEIIDEGMKYTVRIEERIITTPKEEAPYCNIISTKDAIIKNVKTLKGQSVVDENDYVKPGSLLISGQIKFNEEIKNHVCAEGVVYGVTWYTINISFPYKYVDRIYTGKNNINVGIEIGSNYNRIFKVHLNKYETVKTKIFNIGNFAIYKEKNKEYILKNSKYTKEEALEKALELGREKLKLNLDEEAVILSEKVLQTEEYDSIIEMDIFYSVKEIVGKQVEEKAEEIIEEEKGVT